MALTETEQLYNLALGHVGEFQIEDTATSRESKQYELCTRFYDDSRDETLKRHRWNEAATQIVIVEDSTGPLFDYSFRFALPSDTLLVSYIGRRNSFGRPSIVEERPWQVIGEYIYTTIGETAPTWTSGTEYVAGQYINYTSSGTIITYLCNVNNTASALNRPDVDAVTWTSQTEEKNLAYVTYIKQLTDITKFGPLLKDVISLTLASKIVTPLHNDPKAKIALINEIEQLRLPQARSMDSIQGRPKEIFSSRFIRSRWQGTWWNNR